VPHMQATGNIRRRDHDAVGLALAARGEVALLFPGLVPLGFDIGGLEDLFHYV
jgi:hypothetical protein